VAEDAEDVFDLMGAVGDLQLLHDPRGSLERVGEAEQPRDQVWLRAVLLEIEHTLSQLLQQLAGLDPEIAQRVAGHRVHAASCGFTRRSRSLDSPANCDAVCNVWLELASVSRDACAMLAIAMLTCSTAVICCLVESSISRAASVVVPTRPAICV